MSVHLSVCMSVRVCVCLQSVCLPVSLWSVYALPSLCLSVSFPGPSCQFSLLLHYLPFLRSIFRLLLLLSLLKHTVTRFTFLVRPSETLFVPEMDLAFVISTTAVDKDKNLGATKEIIKETVQTFGLSRVRYSLITFGAIPVVKIRFDNVFASEEDLVKIVDNVKKDVGAASLEKALEETRYLFALAEDARPDAKRVVVVITDKKSDSTEESVRAASQKLRNDGVRVIAIVLGNEFDPVSPEVIKPEEEQRPKETAKELLMVVLNGTFKFQVLS